MPGLVIASTVAVRPSIETTAALLVEAVGDVDKEETPQLAIAPAIVPRRSARNNWYEVTAISPCSVDLLDPHVPHGNLRRRLDLDAEPARLIVGRGRIVVDHDRHQLAVDDVRERAAARDDNVLIPVVRLDDRAECPAIGDRAHERLAARA